ncbi:MAG: class I SAM-dependent methyltransferase [Gaiellaceae bacterium]
MVAAAEGVAGKRALDVGSGTGRLAEALAARGARVWGVDPSEEMLAVAREAAGKAVGFKRGEAERLPFKSAWFDLVFLRLVVHLVDRRKVLPELRRVLAPGGKAVIATFDPRHFGSFWLTRFLPSVERIDRARFPEPGVLARELRAAGFGEVAVQPLEERATMTREEALERIRGRYISTLHLLDDDELAAGLAQAERELPPEIEIELHWAVVSAHS